MADPARKRATYDDLLDDDRVRLPPFEAVELEVGAW
jgi:hypothetical protein